MLRCIDIPSRTDGFVDGDAPLTERAAVAVHLAVCGHCRRYVHGVRITRRLIADSFRSEPVAERVDRVMAAASKRTRDRS